MVAYEESVYVVSPCWLRIYQNRYGVKLDRVFSWMLDFILMPRALPAFIESTGALMHGSKNAYIPHP